MKFQIIRALIVLAPFILTIGPVGVQETINKLMAADIFAIVTLIVLTLISGFLFRMTASKSSKDAQFTETATKKLSREAFEKEFDALLEKKAGRKVELTEAMRENNWELYDEENKYFDYLLQNTMTLLNLFDPDKQGENQYLVVHSKPEKADQ